MAMTAPTTATATQQAVCKAAATGRGAAWGTMPLSLAASGRTPAILRRTGGTQVVIVRHLLPLPRATRWTAALPLVFAPLAPPAPLHPYALGV